MTRPVWADFTRFHSRNRENPRVHIRRGESFVPNPIVRGFCHNLMSRSDAIQDHTTRSSLGDNSINWCQTCVNNYLKASEG